MSRTNGIHRMGAIGALILLGGVAYAAAPDAGQTIGNQAAATYESGGQSFLVESNTVTTTVNEVYGLSFVSAESKTSAPGNFVTFAHVITNNANTSDSFNLSAGGATGQFTFDSIEVFADSDNNGVPDNLTPITVTPSLAAGASYGVVVRAQVNSTSAAGGETATFDVTATSVGSATETVTLTDTVNISSDGIVELVKSQALAAGGDLNTNGIIDQGDTVEVTVTYTHTGLSPATNVQIEDILPAVNEDGEAITLTYVPNSASWSSSPGTALDETAGAPDATSGSGDTLIYSYNAGTRTSLAVIDNVPVGNTGTISFQYVVTAAPEGEIINIATVRSTAQTTRESSNPSSYTVLPTNAIVLADTSADSVGGPNVGDDTGANLNTTTSSSTDDGAAEDDVVEDNGDLYPGQSTAFEVILTNLSDVSDTFTLNIANTAHTGSDTFPSGTTFSLVASDGVTPIVGNEVTLAAAEVRAVQVIATLPANAPADTATDYEATVTAISNAAPAVSNAVGLLYTGDVLTGTVDLFNTADSSGTGSGNIDNTGSPFITENANPGDTVTFPLSVTIPAGEPNNSFDLEADIDGDFSSLNLPAGWSVGFYNTSGGVISNTGLVMAGATFQYEARVVIPAGAAASATAQDFYFRVVSPTTSSFDTVRNAINVNEIVDIAIVAGTSANVAPSGIAVIPHTILNLGNSTITAGAISIASSAGTADETDGLPDDPFAENGFAVTFFQDTNDNGILDGTDTAVTNISDFSGLAPGESKIVFVRVQAPGSATAGVTETGDVAVSLSLTSSSGAVTDSNNTNNEVTDTIIVVTGDLTLDKTQGVDANCDGDVTDPGDSAYTSSVVNADPGHCIAYRIVATNSGSVDATLVVINDTIPNFTTYETCTGGCAATGSANVIAAGAISTPAQGASGIVSTNATGFTLTPTETATLDFFVKIDE